MQREFRVPKSEGRVKSTSITIFSGSCMSALIAGSGALGSSLSLLGIFVETASGEVGSGSSIFISGEGTSEAGRHSEAAGTLHSKKVLLKSVSTVDSSLIESSSSFRRFLRLEARASDSQGDRFLLHLCGVDFICVGARLRGFGERGVGEESDLEETRKGHASEEEEDAKEAKEGIE